MIQRPGGAAVQPKNFTGAQNIGPLLVNGLECKPAAPVSENPQKTQLRVLPLEFFAEENLAAVGLSLDRNQLSDAGRVVLGAACEPSA